MNYNTKRKYNFRANNNGLTYNSLGFVIFINLYETIDVNDDLSNVIARMILTERVKALDYMAYSALFNMQEEFNALDSELEQFALFELLEKINLKDVIEKLLVYVSLNEKFSMLDEIKNLFVLFKQYEYANMEDTLTLESLIDISEELKLQELKDFFVFLEQYEYINALDREPRKAISDFFIGQLDDRDTAFDWFAPFDMLVDWRNTDIQIMPQTESSYIDLPNVDGSIIENTIYKNRFFNIVAWTEDGLSFQEKEAIKADIAYILDSTKEKSKKLSFSQTSNAFDVKYSGLATITETQSAVKVQIPFEVQPYGYSMFDKEVYGTGLIVNEGVTNIGVVHIISSGCVNPSFQLGNITYTWLGTVPMDSKLYINHADYTCYLESVEGNKTNAIENLTGEFQLIPKNSSLQITAFGDTEFYLLTTFKEYALW